MIIQKLVKHLGIYYCNFFLKKCHLLKNIYYIIKGLKDKIIITTGGKKTKIFIFKEATLFFKIIKIPYQRKYELDLGK